MEKITKSIVLKLCNEMLFNTNSDYKIRTKNNKDVVIRLNSNDTFNNIEKGLDLFNYLCNHAFIGNINNLNGLTIINCEDCTLYIKHCRF